MSIKNAYNHWANTYDSNKNKTRDLDKTATQQTLQKFDFEAVVELGCGTGKNTEWLVEKAESIIALDFSEGMLAKARAKIASPKVVFRQADITQNWNIPKDSTDLICCNLILEHIEDLVIVFRQTYTALKKGGRFFVCELHPFKQYLGGKARFETEKGVEVLETYTHHISDFTDVAAKCGFRLVELKEWFDEGGNREVPRLLSLVFEK
ncbi:MAG: class I SAM-dependent methyltransferase [Chitinophagales bacterium]